MRMKPATKTAHFCLVPGATEVDAHGQQLNIKEWQTGVVFQQEVSRYTVIRWCPVFSETVVPYYPCFSFVQWPFQMGAEHLRLIEQAVTVPSVATHAIGEASRQTGMVVSIGVDERDGGTLFNTQLLFDADGTLIQRRRKISPTYHERIHLGARRRFRTASCRQRSRAHRSVGVLGALQPAGPLRLDG